MARPDAEEDSWSEDNDDGEDLIACPHCQKPIYEGSERCPYCEQYLSEEDLPTTSGKPWWIIIGVGVCLYAVYRWMIQ